MDLSPLRVLVAAALVDGELQDQEQEYLAQIAMNLHLHPDMLSDLVVEMRAMPADGLKKEIEHLTKKQRISVFRGAAKMAGADRTVNQQELRFMRRLGVTLGFPEREVDEVLARARQRRRG